MKTIPRQAGDAEYFPSLFSDEISRGSREMSRTI